MRGVAAQVRALDCVGEGWPTGECGVAYGEYLPFPHSPPPQADPPSLLTLAQAFNEELDRLYDDAQLTSRDAEIAALREEVKRTKAQRNEAQARCGELEKQGKLQKTQLEAWEGVLRGNGLL